MKVDIEYTVKHSTVVKVTWWQWLLGKRDETVGRLEIKKHSFEASSISDAVKQVELQGIDLASVFMMHVDTPK